jgi:hypothetical protein
VTASLFHVYQQVTSIYKKKEKKRKKGVKDDIPTRCHWCHSQP